MGHTPKKYLGIFGLATLGCGALLTASIVLVDPYGLFGTGLFPALILTNRSEKINALRRMDPPAQAVLMGSSRMFRADPDHLQALTGLRSYNASVSYARPEDHLALIRVIVEDLQQTPRLLVVGVNVAEFNFDPIDPQTITHPLLRNKLPITTSQWLHTLLSLAKERINPQMVRDVMTSFFFRFAAPPPQVAFLPNGMRQPQPGDADDRADRLTRSIPATIGLYAHPGLSPDRVAYFRSFVSYAAGRNIQVHALLLPVAASTEADITSASRYTQHLQELRALFAELAQTTPSFRYTDGTVPHLYHADPDDFADATHPREPLLRSLLDFSLRESGLVAPQP